MYRQTDPQNYTNIESNLAMMVIYLPVKFEFDWTKHFEFESRNGNVDGQTNGKQTHGITPILKQLSYDGDLSPCQV